MSGKLLMSMEVGVRDRALEMLQLRPYIARNPRFKYQNTAMVWSKEELHLPRGPRPPLCHKNLYILLLKNTFRTCIDRFVPPF